MKVKQVVNKFLKAYAEKKEVYPGDEPDDRVRDVEYAQMVRTIFTRCKIIRHDALKKGYQNEDEGMDYSTFRKTIEEFTDARKLPKDEDLDNLVAKLDDFLKQLVETAFKSGYERNPDNLITGVQDS